MQDVELWKQKFVLPCGYELSKGKRSSLVDEFGVRIVSKNDLKDVKFKCLHPNCRNTDKYGVFLNVFNF